MRLVPVFFVSAIMLSLVLPDNLSAADKEVGPRRITIELNKLTPLSGACRISFVVQNRLKSAIEAISLELVIFDQRQQVLKLLIINPGRLPSGKTRVKQFDVKSVGCGDVGRMLLNDVKQCKGGGLTPGVCLDALSPTSRLGVPFIN